MKKCEDASDDYEEGYYSGAQPDFTSLGAAAF